MMEALIPPIVTHLGMDEILIDGRQIRRQNFIEYVDDPFFGFHVTGLLFELDTPFFLLSSRLTLPVNPRNVTISTFLLNFDEMNSQY
jgi:hypothetical protein